eukprot:GGOE01005401.1.p1 GENE.GGOE01005401.1~~GGOE01005401.1.p1  ORF type:complete len:1608 (+),score=424.81 GGOE01005401.1:48-4871(+)
MSEGNRHSQNVLVAARVRPLDPTEAKYGARSIVRCQQNKTIITDLTYPFSEKAFTFDYSFWSGEPGPDVKFSSQLDVYNEIGRGMLARAFEGFNCCIFSYGQTNAGKTYTMMGIDEDPGIIPRFCEELFARVEETPPSAEVSFKVELSYFEIYNERVRCLLNPDTQKKDLRVREHPITGPFVEDLTSYIVEDYEDVLKWMTVGNQTRTVCATKFNQSSSRSHAVFTLTLTQNKMDGEGNCTQVISKINLVDLAGSERCGQTGSVSSDVFKEGVTINKSLSTLGRVIHSLSDQGEGNCHDEGSGGVKKSRQWVGYRDSVLTWLLKENLGGNSKTIMLANISPASSNYEESLNTLRYADRVKYIKNDPVVNEDHNARLIRELKQEINFLRKQLCMDELDAGRACSVMTSRMRPGEDGEDAESLQEWRAKLEMSDQIIAEINQSWMDRLTHSQKVYQEKLLGVERELIGRNNSSSFAIEDMPLLININPHPVPGEQLAHVLRPGETYLGTDDEPITEETKDDIRLSDGFNLSNPHCIFEHHDTGEVEMIPLNGSLSYVNGQLLTTTYILTHGCRIILGSNHVFLFVDPIHSKAFRDHLKAQGGGIPRIIDWSYVSKEFSESMNILAKPEQLQSLRDDVNTLREENSIFKETHDELERSFEEYKRTPFLVLVTEGSTQRDVPSQLYYRLTPGRNGIGPGTAICLPGMKQTTLLEYCAKSGHVYMVLGPKSLSSALPNGHHIISGVCHFQVILPASERPLERRSLSSRSAGLTSPSKPSAHDANGVLHDGRLDPAEQLLFMDDLKHKLFDFQFAVLNMRDQLFPPPPDPPQEAGEGEPPAEPVLSPEEAELHEKRRVLQDDWLLTSKKCTPQDTLDHMSYLQHELRYLTFVSAQREQLVDQLQYAVEQGQQMEAEVTRLHAEVHQWQQLGTAMRRKLEGLGHPVDMLHVNLDEEVPEGLTPRKMTEDSGDSKRRIRELEAKLESLTSAHETLIETYNGLLKKQRQQDQDVKNGGRKDDSDVLQEDVQIALRKLHASELRCAQLQQKLEGRTQDYDTLYYTHQKLKEDTELQRQQLNEINSRLRAELEECRNQLKKPTKADGEHGGNLHKDSIKAFNKMKDTIKLLTKVAKSKDDKIAKLEKELQVKADLLSSTSVRPERLRRTTDASLSDRIPTAADRLHLSPSPLGSEVEGHDGTQNMLDIAMQLVKAEVVHLSRTGLAQLDKIASTVSRSGGVDIFKKAHIFLRRVLADTIGEAGLQEEVWPLTDRDLDRIKTHHRSSLAKAFREMVICYDIIPDFVKIGLGGCDDISRNRANLVRIARFCVNYERSRGDLSPVRGKSSPQHDRDEDKPLKQKRSSSASSNRSSNTTMHSSGTRDTTPSQKAVFTTTATRTTSYISPKRQGIAQTLGASTTARHASPKPGSHATFPTNVTSPPPAVPPVGTSKGRTLSPRPGTTVTPTRIKIKGTSPTPSPDPAPLRRSDTQAGGMRTSSPYSTLPAEKVIGSVVRSVTPKAIKKASSATTAFLDSRSLHSYKAVPEDITYFAPDALESSDPDSSTRRPPPAPRAHRAESPHSTPPSTPKYTMLAKTNYEIPSRLADLRQQQFRTRSPQN